MKQQTLAMAADQNNGFEQSRKPTRREEFLRTMETIVPWAALCQVIEPHYPKAGNGRPPIGLERMLRIHFLQHWFNLADLAQAITLQVAGRLVKVPGIGKKTAERLLLELKGKLGADIGAPTHAASDAQADILQALLALGYNDKEAAAALKALPADVGVSDGIKLALKALAR